MSEMVLSSRSKEQVKKIIDSLTANKYVFLLGPRGSGKTRLIKAAIPEIESLSEELGIPFILIKEERFESFPVKYEFNIERFMKLPFESGALASI